MGDTTGVVERVKQGASHTLHADLLLPSATVCTPVWIT
jgi:hypothetical protein